MCEKHVFESDTCKNNVQGRRLGGAGAEHGRNRLVCFARIVVVEVPEAFFVAYAGISSLGCLLWDVFSGISSLGRETERLQNSILSGFFVNCSCEFGVIARKGE